MSARGRWLRRIPAAAGILGLLLVAAAALAAPTLYPGDPMDMAGQPRLWPGRIRVSVGHRHARPGRRGRARSRSRISLLVGFSAMLATLAIGVSVGATAVMRAAAPTTCSCG